jgi:hypothetical protein
MLETIDQPVLDTVTGGGAGKGQAILDLAETLAAKLTPRQIAKRLGYDYDAIAAGMIGGEKSANLAFRMLAPAARLK